MSGWLPIISSSPMTKRLEPMPTVRPAGCSKSIRMRSYSSTGMPGKYALMCALIRPVMPSRASNTWSKKARQATAFASSSFIGSSSRRAAPSGGRPSTGARNRARPGCARGVRRRLAPAARRATNCPGCGRRPGSTSRSWPHAHRRHTCTGTQLMRLSQRFVDVPRLDLEALGDLDHPLLAGLDLEGLDRRRLLAHGRWHVRLEVLRLLPGDKVKRRKLAAPPVDLPALQHSVRIRLCDVEDLGNLGDGLLGGGV